MSATDAPPRKLARDVRRVEWLPPEAALAKLTHARERDFLRRVAPVIFGHAIGPQPGFVRRLWHWLRARFVAVP